MEKPIILSDKLNQKDIVSSNPATVRIKHPSPYARTQIKFVDEFGRTIYEDDNQVVIGGTFFTAAKVWDIQFPIPVGTLNDILGIANTGPVPVNLDKTFVTLFGVGYGGAGDSAKSVKDVKFYEREIFDMVPFRVPDGELTDQEKQQYFFRKELENGKTAYYLKKFEEEPKGYALWKDGPEGEDGTVVEPGVHNTTRTEQIEVFVEMHLKLTKKDIKEYFAMNGNIDETKINSIGLVTGVLADLGDGTTDFKNTWLFSKLNIPNEILVLKKDMDVYYRVYLS